MSVAEKSVAAILPVGEPRETFAALSDRAADLEALAHAADRAASKARAVKIEATSLHARLVDPSVASAHGEARLYQEDNSEVVRRKERADQATDEYERLAGKAALASARWQRVESCRQRIVAYLRENAGRATGTLNPHIPTKAGKDVPAGGLDKAIAAARDRVATAKADAHTIRSAPWPSSHCKRAAREHVAELAERGRLDVFGLVETGSAEFIKVAAVHADHVFSDSGYVDVRVHDALGLLASIVPDRLLAAIDAEIDAAADDSNALTAEERNAELDRLADEQIEAERALVGLLASSPDSDEQFDPTIDVRAVLRIIGPEPRTA